MRVPTWCIDTEWWEPRGSLPFWIRECKEHACAKIWPCYCHFFLDMAGSEGTLESGLEIHGGDSPPPTPLRHPGTYQLSELVGVKCVFIDFHTLSLQYLSEHGTVPGWGAELVTMMCDITDVALMTPRIYQLSESSGNEKGKEAVRLHKERIGLQQFKFQRLLEITHWHGRHPVSQNSLSRSSFFGVLSTFYLDTVKFIIVAIPKLLVFRFMRKICFISSGKS